MNIRTNRNILQREAVADTNFRRRPVHNLHAVGQAGRSQNIALFAILIADEGNIGGSVRIIFHTDDLGGNAVLCSLKIDQSVLPAVSATPVSYRDFPLVVSACSFVE